MKIQKNTWAWKDKETAHGTALFEIKFYYKCNDISNNADSRVFGSNKVTPDMPREGLLLNAEEEKTILLRYAVINKYMQKTTKQRQF